MKKNLKRIALLLLAIMIIVPLAACDEDEPAATTFKITLLNNTGYTFNRLFISPTAEDSWGPDLLGSTSILKGSGEIDLTLNKQSVDNFDIRVVDEDNDEYIFTLATLTDGATAEIFFDNGPKLLVVSRNGSEAILSGDLIFANQGYDGDYDDYDDDDEMIASSAEPVYFDFMIYNESGYTLHTIYIAPFNVNFDEINLLGNEVLAGGESFHVNSRIPDEISDITDFIFRAIDFDGDSGDSYAIDISTLMYIDIDWGGTEYTFADVHR